MLYLVSGTSRSGKSLLAKRILQEKHIPYLSLDWLMMGFNDGMPQVGIHHLLWPNEIAEKMWPFLQGMFANMLYDGMDYVIEGEALLPELISEFSNQNSSLIRCVFLGYTKVSVADKISQVQQFSRKENDWLTEQDDDYIAQHIGNMLSYSKTIRKQCEKYSMPYIDTSSSFSKALDDAMDLLFSS